MYLWLHLVCNNNAKDNCYSLPLFHFFLSFLPSPIFSGYLLCASHFDKFDRITSNKTHKLTEIWRIENRQSREQLCVCWGGGGGVRSGCLSWEHPLNFPLVGRAEYILRTSALGTRWVTGSVFKDEGVGWQGWYHAVPGSPRKETGFYGKLIRSHSLGGREGGGVPNYQCIVKDNNRNFFSFICYPILYIMLKNHINPKIIVHLKKKTSARYLQKN